MEQRSRNHLERAHQNQQYSVLILSRITNETSTQIGNEPTAELLWSVVAAFYGAVHYVNAFLYEMHNHFVPRTHAERERTVFTDARLRSVALDYSTLKDWSIQARYDPVPGITEADAHDALAALERIADVIVRELPEAEN